MTNSERLAALGQALYGERWQRAVARDLDKDERQVRRWSDEYEPSDEIVAKLLEVARTKRAELADVIKRCK